MKWEVCIPNEDYTGTIWMCAGCRSIPSSITDIKTKLDSFIKNNQDLTTRLSSRDQEFVDLQAKVVAAELLYDTKVSELETEIRDREETNELLIQALKSTEEVNQSLRDAVTQLKNKNKMSNQQLQNTNLDLVKQLSAKIAECQEQKHEIEELRKRITNGEEDHSIILENSMDSTPRTQTRHITTTACTDTTDNDETSPNPRRRSRHSTQDSDKEINVRSQEDIDVLLLGDSIIRDAHTSVKKNVRVECIRGGRIIEFNEKTAQLKWKGERPDVVIIHAGTNDSSDQIQTKHIVNDFKMLIQGAKDLALNKQVIVSGICPHTDDKDIQLIASHVNRELERVCQEVSCTFVNHELTTL